VDPARLDESFPQHGDHAHQPTAPVWWEPRPKFKDRVWLHVLLLLLTLGSTSFVGLSHYLSFISDFSSTVPQGLSLGQLALRGLWYSGTVLAILGCHELGHYYACRYYDVDASLPYFLPFPLSIIGTFGAFIKIREPIPAKRMLFDIGIAGPIAGFVVTVPALFIGVAMSHVVRIPEGFVGYELGEPLLFKLTTMVLWGTVPDGYSLNLHPMAFAAWFGMLATALNLFPIGQLDGGHISYAVLGPRSVYVTMLTFAIAAVLAYFHSSWIVWTFVLALMLFTFGPRHPRVFDEHVPLDRSRIALSVAAFVIFVLCFTPAPLEPTELLGR
jgi:membrane-associated protease RseP (regulator of RpoE activity)